MIQGSQPSGEGPRVSRDPATGAGRSKTAVPRDPATGAGRSKTSVPRDPATGFGRSATTVPKKGQPDPPSKTETVAQVAKSTAVGLKSILMWVVPIAAAVIALYFIFLGDKAPAEVRTPDATIMTYTETVQMYVPPAGRMPSQDGVSTWLNFFDGPSRLWFNENVDKLAFIMNQDKPEEFMDWPDTKKRSEAMKFLLTQPPLGGVVKVISVYNDEDNGTAQVEVRAGLGQASFSMVEKDDRWQFQDMMGKKIQIGQIIAPLNPPKRNR